MMRNDTLQTVHSVSGGRVWFWPEVVITVEDWTVCKQQCVVVVHRGLCGTFLRPSFEATHLQAALWRQACRLCGDPAPENLHLGSLDPDAVLDGPDEAENSAAARQNHLKVSWMGRGRVEVDQSDAQTDEAAGWWQ